MNGFECVYIYVPFSCNAFESLHFLFVKLMFVPEYMCVNQCVCLQCFGHMYVKLCMPLSLLTTRLCPPLLLPPGQDERSEPQQCGGSLLHPDRRPGPGHAGGAGGVLLQVPDRVAPNEGVHRASRCRLSRSGLSLLSLRQWC